MQKKYKIRKIQDILKMKEYLPTPRINLENLVGKNVVIFKIVPKTSKKYDKPGFEISLKNAGQQYDIFTCARYVVRQLADVVQKNSELGVTECALLCKVDKVNGSLTLVEYDGPEPTIKENNNNVSAEV